MVSHFTVDSAHTLREGDSVVDNHTPARGILDMFSSQGLAQDLVPGRGLKTYPGGQGMGCDYNIIDHLEKYEIVLNM